MKNKIKSKRDKRTAEIGASEQRDRTLRVEELGEGGGDLAGSSGS